MKKQTTKEAIAGSFRELAAQKDVSKITINEIVRNCGMSPATFYRHFHDKYDLIGWMYSQKCDKIFQNFNDSPARWEKTIDAWIRFCTENKDLLINLFNNTSGYDSFLPKMVAKHVQLAEDTITARNGKNAITEKEHLKLYMYFSGLALFICNWLMGKISASREQLIEAILESLSTQENPQVNPEE